MDIQRKEPKFRPAAYTASWSRVGGTAWPHNSASKTHAFVGFDHPQVESHEITLCGIDFETLSEDDKLRAAAHGHLTREGSYMVDVGENLTEVDCKRCLKSLMKLKRGAE